MWIENIGLSMGNVLIVLFSYLSIRIIWLSKKTWNVLSSFIFYNILCRICYLFLKSLVEFSSENIWAWIFLCGKKFNCKFNIFNQYRTSEVHLFLLEWALVDCVPQGTCILYLSCQIYRRTVIFVFPIILFISMSYSNVPSFIVGSFSLSSLFCTW